MKAQYFRAVVDDRDRITIPISNVKTINKKYQSKKSDWKGAVVEMQIKTIRLRDGTKINFDTFK